MKLKNLTRRMITVGRKAVLPFDTSEIVAYYAATDSLKAMVSLGYCELIYEDGDEELVAKAEAAKLTTYDINRIYSPDCCCGGGSSSGSSGSSGSSSSEINELTQRLDDALEEIEEIKEKEKVKTPVDVTVNTEAQLKNDDEKIDFNLYKEEGIFIFPTSIPASDISNSTGTINGKLVIYTDGSTIYQTLTDTDGIEYGRTFKNNAWGTWTGYIDDHSVEDEVLIL